MQIESRLAQALRTIAPAETQEYLKHRNALRRTITRVVFELDACWSMEDDAILDEVERWLRGRIRPEDPVSA